MRWLMTGMEPRLVGLVVRALIFAVVAIVLAGAVMAFEIWRFGGQRSDGPADAAIVLGAAVDDDRPSPVLVERLRHAADLYAKRAIGKIVVTGGLSPGDRLSEAEASRNWLVAQGIPAADILREDKSRTTIQNIDNALPLLRANGIDSVLVVSDPLHQKRAMLIAERRGLQAASSPTPTTRYQSPETQIPFVLREVWFLIQFAVAGI